VVCTGTKIPTSLQAVYVAGCFDLFHAGHVELLEKARELGHHLLVGVYSDADARESMGAGFPIMDVKERSLNLLACKLVDDVLVNAPRKLTKEDIIAMNISFVVGLEGFRDTEEYQAAQEMGIFVPVQTTSRLTSHEIARRVLHNREELQASYERKKKKEECYTRESVAWRKDLSEL